MIDSAALLKDLKVQLKILQADLRERAEDAADAWSTRLREEYAEARHRERTSHSWGVWRDNEVDQAAVAWLVGTTFLRFCEDNDLLAGAHLDGHPTPIGWIAGPGDRTQRTEENLTAYFHTKPTHNRRHWLQQGFRVLAAQAAGRALVDPQRNPVWTALVSPGSAGTLIEFWRRTDGTGALVHDFTDRERLGTRFLGDLYQDLSAHAKKTYALRQTPVFVEEFILDQTLMPALKEFGRDGLKVIDSTCGSGHFLLGAFERLEQKWREEAPALDAKERVRRAMDSIYGVDLNPFAVAIARFRLTVAGLKVTGEQSLVGVSTLGFHLAIGDSLLGEQGGVPDTLDVFSEEEKTYLYDTEDLADYMGILEPGQYHVVVGNPPYITVKDKALSKLYRKAYKTAHRQYALSVPFMELFFRLAIRGEQGRGAGYVGQITANSFMKREFGKKLIEELFAGNHLGNPVDLTKVIDSSGAHIPGHGTPTVILIGRRRRPASDTVRAVLGVRGEPGQPEDPAKGLVWTEMVNHIDDSDYDGAYVTVTDLDRATLTAHPWSLSGGGAHAVRDAVEAAGVQRLHDVAHSIGLAAISGEDQFYLLGDTGAARRLRIDPAIAVVRGDIIRDYMITTDDTALWTQDADLAVLPLESMSEGSRQLLSSFRYLLGIRKKFGISMLNRRLTWWEWREVYAEKIRASRTISFPLVATHNHFSLDRSGSVFHHSATVIRLPEGADEDGHLELLGVLNSSTACFWLKEVCHDKGNGGYGGGIADQEWERFFEFTSTKLEQFPLPAKLPLERGRSLDRLACEFVGNSPRAVVATWLEQGAECTVSLSERLKEAEVPWQRLRARMIFEQEELDWDVYRLYGLLDDDHAYRGRALDQLTLGQRAFEIALARREQTGEEETAWFSRHGSTPIVDLPTEWPDDYAGLVKRRLFSMESDPSIRLLEKPEFKRRWAIAPWADQVTSALEAAILDRLEHPSLWRDGQGPTTRSVADLADQVRADAVLRELVAELTGNAEPDLAVVVGSLVVEQAVPYLAAFRYKLSGLEKFRVWQQVRALQRHEDAGEKVDIAVPPKYSKSDFRKEYWKARGKLDVPKERFILYPNVRREGDQTPVLGWAGWDHRDQALALGRELPVQEMLGADDDALTQMIAGLAELEPWLHQWHHEDDPAFGANPAAVISQLIDQYLLRLEKTREQVSAWEPPAATRGRRPKRS